MIRRRARKATTRKPTILKAEATTAPNLTLAIGSVAIQAASGDDKYLRTFKLHANTGGFTHLPGFDAPVVIELSSMWRGDEQIPLLRDHDFRQPVGHATELQITAAGVEGMGETSVPGGDRQEIVDAADNGFDWQLSVGGTADPNDIVYIESGQSLEVNGKTRQGPFYYVINYHLREISFVALGADSEGATATLVAALDKGQTMKFAQWLKTRGHDIDTLTAEQLTSLRGEYETWLSQTGGSEGAEDGTSESSDDSASGESDDSVAGSTGDETQATTTQQTQTVVQPPGPTAGGDDSYLQSRADQVQQAAELETLNAQFGNPTIEVGGREIPLLAHAMRQGWNRDRFELEHLRRRRPEPIERRSEGGSNAGIDMNAALVGALMARGGVALDNTAIGNTTQGRMYLNAAFRADVNDPGRQRWMEQADRFRHHSLADMIIECGMANGLDLRQFGHFRGNGRWLRAAFSSMEIVDMFTQSITAVLLDSYEQENNTLFPMVRRRDVPNFLTQERKRMLLNSNDFEKHLPTETASDMVLSSTGETYKIARFSKMLSVNEETLIDERWDVIEDQPRAMGEAAARLDPELILAVLLNNPNMADGNAFLNTTDGNLRTTSAFTRDNLKSALIAFQTQQEGGVTLNLSADGLFHAVGLTFDVAEVLAAARLITATGGARTDTNVLANIVNPISDARLDNGFNDPDDRSTAIAGEATSWFLFNTRYPAIELGHLQGTGGNVQIDSGTMNQGQWGIWFAAKKDGGAAPLRRESIQKNEA